MDQEGCGMSMDWTQWVLVVLLTLGPIVTASNVGKPRKPITPSDAAWSVFINIGLLMAVMLWG
jgi:hypothetical protein